MNAMKIKVLLFAVMTTLLAVASQPVSAGLSPVTCADLETTTAASAKVARTSVAGITEGNIQDEWDIKIVDTYNDCNSRICHCDDGFCE